MKILWIDDQTANEVEATWGGPLERRLSDEGVSIEIDYLQESDGATVRARKADFIVLDIQLGNRSVLGTAFQVLDQLKAEGIGRPVVLVSSHLEGGEGHYRSQLDKYAGRYLKAFPKSRAGIGQLAEFLVGFIRRPPLTLILMSDIHVGCVGHSASDLNRQFGVLEEDLGGLQERVRPEFLVVCGDFVWTDQAKEFPLAAGVIRKIRRALNLTHAGAMHFCPGNHDAVLNNPQAWEPYRTFVEDLAVDDELLRQRYLDRLGRIGFSTRDDVLSVGSSSDDQVLFASLNSADPRLHAENGAIIGDEQWIGLRNLVRGRNGDQLRIALMHHPLYPVPSDRAEGEEPIVRDSARAFRELHSLKFQLVISGHSHYSCLHVHELTVLNPSVALPQTQRLVVVTLPTLGGSPSGNTPFRQYAIARIGHLDVHGNTRSLAVQTRVYSGDSRSFSDGHEYSTFLVQ